MTATASSESQPAPPRGYPNALRRYGLALLLVIGVTLLRLPVAPLLGNSVPFILYFPAIVVAGWFGGAGPGLLATLLSGYAARTWFFEPKGDFAIPDLPSAFRLGLFLASGILISLLCGRLHRRTRELTAQKLELENKVRERTEHLERALQDMEAFSYSVSHDLRAPVRAMQGYSEVLIEDYGSKLEGPAREHLVRISTNAGRLDRMISHLLQLAKVSGATIETQPLALTPIIQRVIESSARLSSPEVGVSSERCTDIVLGNETLLHQILQNLMENGAKFVEPGKPVRLLLWTERSEGRVRLWVEDNGIGIAPQHRQRLFKLFEQLNGHQYGGTGVGLAIVERAVSKMNGRVGVESEPGAGSRFWIELPGA